jgi:hypothetical protein
MNERIQELAVEAGLIVATWDGFNRRQLVPAERRFAELIVRECLEACSRANEIRHFVPPTQEQVVLSCMREIETTFRS